MTNEHASHMNAHAHTTHETLEHQDAPKRKTSNNKHPRAHLAAGTTAKKSESKRMKNTTSKTKQTEMT